MRPVPKPVKQSKTKKTRIGSTDRKKIVDKIDRYDSDIGLILGNFTCMMCGKTATAIHHFFPKGSHGNVRFNKDNHCPICYGCHMFRIGMAGEFEEIRDKLIERIGINKFEQLKRDAYRVADYSIKDLKEILLQKQLFIARLAETDLPAFQRLSDAGQRRLRSAKKAARENIQS